MDKKLKSIWAAIEAIFTGIAIASFLNPFIQLQYDKLIIVGFMLACPIFILLNRLKLNIYLHGTYSLILIIVYAIFWIPFYWPPR